jgi:hypothetical protein
MSQRDFDIADALASLRTAVRTGVPAPAAALLRARAEQRMRARHMGALAVAAVAVVALLLTVGAAVQRNAINPGPAGGTETPTGSPTAAPRPDRPVPSYPVIRVDDPIARVDWAGATVTGVPPRGPACPSGRLRFRGGATAGYPRMSLVLEAPRPPVFGDLTGDGRAEAVIVALCEGDEQGDHHHSQLLVVGRQASGALVALGWAGPVGWGIVYGFWLSGDRLVIEPEPTAGTYTNGQTLEYRWVGGRFAAQDTGWPGIGPFRDRIGPRIDLGSDDGHVIRTLGCSGPIQIRPEGRAPATAPSDAYFEFEQPVATQHVLDLAGDGHRYVLVAVSCVDRVRSTVDSGGSSAPVLHGQGVLVLDVEPPTGAIRAVDLVPVPLDLSQFSWTFERGRLTVSSFRVSDGNEGPTRRWIWNGAYFQPEV